MSYALRVLFEALQASAPGGSQVSVSTRQMGNFVLLVGRVVASIDAHKTHPIVQTTAQPGDTGRATQASAQSPRDPQVRWLMCRRIIALHAGQLKLETLPPEAGADPTNPPIESFTLTLATGQPMHERSRASCNGCTHVLQAQAYAADLALVLSQS